MNKNQPINFIANHFIYPKGNREYFKGEREYVSLPDKEKCLINNMNIWDAIREIFIPISQMAANIKNYQFCNSLDGTERIAFYDLECNSEEDFDVGYVNEKKFKDPKEMIKELMNYDIAVGFNILRFDNEVLRKYAPEFFLEVKNADFSGYTLNGVLMIDLFSIISVIVGLENYSAEYLAQSNSFPEKTLSHNDDKEKKCEQDIRINKFLWEKYNIPSVFNTLSTLSNLDTTLMQIIRGERLRKWILVNKYLREGYLPLKTNMSRANKVQIGAIKLAKKGLYEDMVYWDISSTYPTAAANLKTLGIYGEDGIFSKMEEELLELAKNKDLKPFMKSIGNPLVGAEYSVNEFWRNDDIFEKIVKTVSDKVRIVLDSRGDVVYTNTDCFIVPEDSPEVRIEGYNVKKDYAFKVIYVYNANKWIGITDKRIEFRGFRRLNSRSVKVLQIAREEILNRLSKAEDKEDFKNLLDSGEELVKTTLKNLKKNPTENFKVVVRKKDEYVRDLSLSNIWGKLKKGFNELYFNKKGEYTLDPKEIDYNYYKDEILSLTKEYSTILE